MKKILFVLVAVIAVSMISCRPKTNPEAKSTDSTSVVVMKAAVDTVVADTTVVK